MHVRTCETDYQLCRMIDIVAPAGSVHSTPTDMAKYMNYLINNYDYYKDLVSSTSRRPRDGTESDKHRRHSI